MGKMLINEQLRVLKVRIGKKKYIYEAEIVVIKCFLSHYLLLFESP